MIKYNALSCPKTFPMKYIFILPISVLYISLYSQTTLFNKTYDLDVIWEWGLGFIEGDGHYYMLQQKVGSISPEKPSLT